MYGGVFPHVAERVPDSEGYYKLIAPQPSTSTPRPKHHLLSSWGQQIKKAGSEAIRVKGE